MCEKGLYVKPRGSRPEVFYEKGVLQNCPIFTGKNFSWSLFFIKATDLQGSLCTKMSFNPYMNQISQLVNLVLDWFKFEKQ